MSQKTARGRAIALSRSMTLISRLTNSLKETSERISALEERLRLAEEHATTDSLTGLLVRRAFDSVLDEMLEQLLRDEYDSMSLIFIDIDHFKKINDTYGHHAGDVVLKSISHLITDFLERHTWEHTAVRGRHNFQNVRMDRRFKPPSVARWGGEEIILCVPDLVSPYQFGDELRWAVEHLSYPEYPTISVTVSVGIAILYAESNPNGIKRRMLAKADDLLYEAKSTGRNCVLVGTVD